MSNPATALSVNLIVKNCSEALKKCFDSLRTLVREGDEVVVVDTGSNPEELAALHELKKCPLGKTAEIRIIERGDMSEDVEPLIKKWLPDYLEKYKEFYGDYRVLTNFAAARQVALDASRNPVVFWIDSDDILVEPRAGKTREFIDKEMPNHDAIFLDYRYAFDPDGVCTTTLRRERFFWREKYHWMGLCHETAIPRPGAAVTGKFAILEGVGEIHHTEFRKPSEMSDVRNYVIQKREYETDGQKVDPRTIFYLANAARGLARFKEADALYRQFDSVSGSADDRYSALYYRGVMYLDPRVQRPVDAKDVFLQCIELSPDPRGYFGLSRAYFACQRYQQCLLWYRRGTELPIPRNQILSYDPTHANFHPHVIASTAAIRLENYEAAAEFASRALSARPNHAAAEDMKSEMRNLQAIGSLSKSFDSIIANLTYGGPNAKRVVRAICDEMHMIPDALEKRGISKFEPPDPRDAKPELVIFCGETIEPWGPQSAETGTGGSEKMVLLISAELQLMGHWNVSVYCNVPKEYRGIDQVGVNWQHWASFDEDRPRDVFVAWRNPGALSMPVSARKRVLWCHDVQNPAAYTQEVKALVDYVQLQSEYHAEPLRGVLKPEQIWVARNAVEMSQTLHAPRNPKQVIYFSSADRGLATALEVVRRARLKDPDIHLVVAYGITPFARKIYANQGGHGYVIDLGRETSYDLYEKEIGRLMDETESICLQRVGFERLANVILGSGVWLYPTRFWEISCMAAMEAQALGCVPLATDFAALKETLLPQARALASPLPELPETGTPNDVWFDQAAQQLLEAVQIPADDPRRLELAKAAWKRFSIKSLAQQWTNKLKDRSLTRKKAASRKRKRAAHPAPVVSK